MMRGLKGLVLMVFAMSLIIGCKQKTEQTGHQEKTTTDQSMVKVNKYLVKSEKEDIENYIRRHGLVMEETGTGLSYMVYEKGEGAVLQEGQIVELKYKMFLLTGDLIYSSDETGPMVFEIGHGGVESGLEEAMLNLRNGDKAKLIIPSHLAHGLLGDDNKIPPRATVIYDIEIVSIK